jgi:hypothetical protein
MRRLQTILEDLGPYVKANGAAPLVAQEDLVRHALVFTPNSIVLTDTHLDTTLPDGWDRRPLTVPMIESGTLLYAVNPSLSAGMTLTALRRDKVSDPLGYIGNRRALLLAGLVGSEASEVATLEIGGRRAFQFDATGILGSGEKITFIVTLIEGQGEIALLSRWVSAADYADNKVVMADLASAVMGFSEETPAAASGPDNGATPAAAAPAAAAPPVLGTPPAALPAPGPRSPAPSVPAPAAPTEKQS